MRTHLRDEVESPIQSKFCVMGMGCPLQGPFLHHMKGLFSAIFVMVILLPVAKRKCIPPPYERPPVTKTTSSDSPLPGQNLLDLDFEFLPKTYCIHDFLVVNIGVTCQVDMLMNVNNYYVCLSLSR